MNEAAAQENLPPKLKRTLEGRAEVGSLADLLEWFLAFDERIAL